jgi:hypothetical protein
VRVKVTAPNAPKGRLNPFFKVGIVFYNWSTIGLQSLHIGLHILVEMTHRQGLGDAAPAPQLANDPLNLDQDHSTPLDSDNDRDILGHGVTMDNSDMPGVTMDKLAQDIIPLTPTYNWGLPASRAVHALQRKAHLT